MLAEWASGSITNRFPIEFWVYKVISRKTVIRRLLPQREFSPSAFALAKHPFFVIMETTLKVFRGLLAWHAPLRLTFNDGTKI